jgi:aspartyl-tRNA(Asn)/glutamyl-tRNA(Gln) amidotransferase subunit A
MVKDRGNRLVTIDTPELIYEFAYGFPTTKSYFKPARNPWNLVYDAGGSSSGSGSPVSVGLVYASMGSCTGGSIRWPASRRATWLMR